MNIQYAKEFLKEFINKNPDKKDEAMDLYELMLEEIEQGGSEINELNIFINECKNL